MGVHGDLKLRRFLQGSTRDCVLFQIPIEETHFSDENLEKHPSHVVVFRYGSVVFFNFPRNSDSYQKYIEVCKKYAAEPLPQPNEDGILPLLHF